MRKFALAGVVAANALVWTTAWWMTTTPAGTAAIVTPQAAERMRAAEAAERCSPERSLVHVLGIAYVLRDAGAFSEARLRFEAALELTPAQADVMLELADLALWQGDTGTALRWAEAAGVADGTHPGVDRVRGAVAMLEGDPARAIPLLDRAIDVDEPDAVALCWRAEAALRTQQWDDAHDLLSRANVRAEGFFFVAWILRFVLVAISERGLRGDDERIDARRLEEFREAVEEMVPGSSAVFERGDPDEIVALLDGVLARMRGNRSSLATWVDEQGTLRRVLARDGVRHASRRALQLVRTLPPAQVVAALDELVAKHPDTPLPVCHRGELHLWLGDLERARADLEAAIELHRFTRWAWIGLTGIDILEGDPERALQTSERGVRTMGNTTGPAVYAYRGEAYRLVGDLERARADLEQAIALTPTRIAAWMDLALVHVAAGQLAELERIWTHLERAAPGLLSDASRELGECLWVDAGFVPTVAATARVLEHGLFMMRGNRATSCATYFTRCGRLRFVQPYAASAKGTHDEDARTLQSARALLR